MNELIKVDFDTQTVSARELHIKLNIGTEFAKWFSRMCEYGFTEKSDYSEVIVKKDENRQGGRPATDYILSMDLHRNYTRIRIDVLLYVFYKMKTYYVEYTRKIMKLDRPTVIEVKAHSPQEAVQAVKEVLSRDPLYEVLGVVGCQE